MKKPQRARKLNGCEGSDDDRTKGIKLVCKQCGCTDDRACPGGCAWYSKDPPLCTACYVANAMAPADAMRSAARKAGFRL